MLTEAASPLLAKPGTMIPLLHTSPSPNKSMSSSKRSRKSTMDTHDRMEIKFSPPEVGVSKGRVAIYAGMPEKRFIVPTRCLIRSDLGSVLVKSGKRGILRICYEPEVFDKAVRQIEEAFCLKFVAGCASYYHNL